MQPHEGQVFMAHKCPPVRVGKQTAGAGAGPARAASILAPDQLSAFAASSHGATLSVLSRTHSRPAFSGSTLSPAIRLATSS